MHQRDTTATSEHPARSDAQQIEIRRTNGRSADRPAPHTPSSVQSLAPLKPQPVNVLRFTTLPKPAATALVAHFADNSHILTDATFGETIPTRVLFAPEPCFAASLHYMFFPQGTRQRFHWHPGGRHLLILGDTELLIRYSSCSKSEDPHLSAQTELIEATTMAFVRFPAETWHEFSAPSDQGSGIIAFSFHDADDLISSGPNLMDELTTFWPESNHKEKTQCIS